MEEGELNAYDNFSQKLKEVLSIFRTILSVMAVLMLLASLIMLTAVACDIFGVYLPGMEYIIPQGVQEDKIILKNPTSTPTVVITKEDRIIVVEKTPEEKDENEKRNSTP